MKTKLLELRDEGTFIPILAVDMNPDNDAQSYLLRRCGYPCSGKPNVGITALRADGDSFWNDPYGWGRRGESQRTWGVAHNYILDHWDELNDGDVIDVQFILGETAALKVSESVTVPI